MMSDRTLYLVLGTGAALALILHGCQQRKDHAREATPPGDAMAAPPMAAGPEADAAPGVPAVRDATALEPSRPVSSGVITFTRRYPGVGTLRTERKSQTVALTVEHGGKSLRLENVDTEETREEVLAVTDRIVSRLRVTFADKTRLQRMNGQERTKRSPLAGRTVVLEVKGGQPVVLDGEGRPLPEAEARLVLEERRSFGKPAVLLDALPTGPIKVGDQVDALAEAVKQQCAEDLARGDRGGKAAVESATVGLREVRAQGDETLGVFAVTLRVRIEQGRTMSMVASLAGTVTLRARDGWPVAVAWEGPVAVRGRENAGRMALRRTTAYGQR